VRASGCAHPRRSAHVPQAAQDFFAGGLRTGSPRSAEATASPMTSEAFAQTPRRTPRSQARGVAAHRARHRRVPGIRPMRPDRRPGTDRHPCGDDSGRPQPRGAREPKTRLRSWRGAAQRERAGSSPSPSPSPTLATRSASDTHWPTDCRPGGLPAINSAATRLWGIERRVLDAHPARNKPSFCAGFEIPHQRPSTAPCSAKPFIDAANPRAAVAPPCHDGEGAGPGRVGGRRRPACGNAGWAQPSPTIDV
jgi:hypothetical protein